MSYGLRRQGVSECATITDPNGSREEVLLRKTTTKKSWSWASSCAYGVLTRCMASSRRLLLCYQQHRYPQTEEQKPRSGRCSRWCVFN